MKLDKAMNRINVIYKCVFIIAMLISAVPFLHEKYSQYIKILLPVGGVLLLYEVYKGWKNKSCPPVLRSKYVWCLCAFIASYGVTILINRSGHFSENVKAWCYMIIILVLFFGVDMTRPRETVIKEIRCVYRTIIYSTFVCSLICFWTFLIQLNVMYKIEGAEMHIGLYDNRLWGLYNPNTGATLNVISIIMTLAALLEQRKTKKYKGKRVFFIFNLILQYLCLVLCGSRAPTFSLLMGVGIMIIVLLPKKLAKTGLITIGHYAKAAVVALVMIAVLLGVEGSVRNGLCYVPHICYDITETPRKVSTDLVESKLLPGTVKIHKAKNRKVSLTRKEKTEEREGGMLTGRTDLWNAGLQEFKKTPVFGIGRENIYDRCKPYITSKIWLASLDVGGLHNMYLTILVSSGIVGFLIFAVFVILTLKGICRYGFKRQGFTDNHLFLASTTILFSMAVMETMEARILYRVGIFYVLFFLIYGYTMYFVQAEDQEKSDENH